MWIYWQVLSDAADAGDSIDRLYAFAVLEGQIRDQDPADIMFLAFSIGKGEVAAGRMDDDRSAVFILAEQHHDMARLEQQRARNSLTDQRITLSRRLAIERDIHRQGQFLLVGIAWNHDTEAAIDVLCEGRTIDAVILSAPAVFIAKEAEGLFDQIIAGIGQETVMQFLVGGYECLMDDKTAMIVCLRKPQSSFLRLVQGITAPI